MLDVPHELVEQVSWLSYARRRELCAPWRRLGCFYQALLALAHLRKNETFAQFDAGSGVLEATVWRSVDETLDALRGWLAGWEEARRPAPEAYQLTLTYDEEKAGWALRVSLP